MRIIDDYIDAAKSSQNIPSDNKLAVVLGINHSSISNWRTKRTWPADSTMVRLAKLAGVDPREALVDLSIWRNGDDGEVQTLWADLKKKLSPIAAMLCLCIGLAVALPHDVQAKTNGADMVSATRKIMEIKPSSRSAFDPFQRCADPHRSVP